MIFLKGGFPAFFLFFFVQFLFESCVILTYRTQYDATIFIEVLLTPHPFTF
jgi:hypothetical protein